MRHYTSALRTAAMSLCVAFAAGFTADARTWDFSSIPDADIALLNADAAHWTYESGNDRWKNIGSMTVSPLLANGTELTLTAGLRFTATGDDNIRVDNKKHSVTLNKKSGVITIPGLKKGDTVTISAQSSSSSSARALTPGNLTVTSGFTASTDRLDNVGTVTEDGDVTVTPSGGFYIYSIAVSENGGTPGGGGDTPGPVSDHSVAMNLSANQLLLASPGNVKYYNTADLASISFDSSTGSVSLTPRTGDWTDSYAGTVTGISFAKSQTSGGEGQITDAGIDITYASGWLETVYAKWALLDGASSYHAYIKGGAYADWTRVDQPLLRRYPTCGRVDIPGLPAGSYSVKIVAVDASGNETSAHGIAEGMTVTPLDRSGFAWKDRTAIGAYDATGALLDNARVLYVTSATAKTVTLDVKVSSTKSQTFTGLQAIVNAYQKGVETRPLAVRIIGTIRDTDMDSFSSSSEGLQVKGKNSYSEVPITFEGIGDDAAIHGFGILCRNCSGTEFRNFGILWFMDDGLSLDTDNSHIWAHHLDIFYGKKGSAADQVKGDGSIDVKADSKYVTIAYCHFWDSGKCSLCGMKSETGPNYIDYHHNWFDHSDSRHPRVRTMTVHVWNNYYDGVSKYGAGATMGSSVFVENNCFRATHDPMLISRQGTDAKGSGTFSGEAGGMIKSFGNLYVERKGDTYYIPLTQNESADNFDCYEASARDEQVPATFVTKAGGTPYDNFDTDPALMHSYTPAPAVEVPSIVTGYYGAGRLDKGDFRWEFKASDDTNYNVDQALSKAVETYTSTLVGCFE